MGRHHTAIVARLREAGLRVTAPRVAVLEELERNRSHPNPIEVHRLLRARHPSLSLSTVYLTVETFANAGLLRRMAARDGRLRVDGAQRREISRYHVWNTVIKHPRRTGAMRNHVKKHLRIDACACPEGHSFCC